MPTGIYDRTKSKPNSGWFVKGHPSDKKGKSPSQETKDRMKRNHADFNGDKHPRWKGGKFLNRKGRIFVYFPSHPNCNYNGYIFEHRLVMEKHLGRYLKKEEVVHHKGVNFPIDSLENKSDNCIENLQLLPNKGAHSAIHNKLRSGRKYWIKRNKKNI